MKSDRETYRWAPNASDTAATTRLVDPQSSQWVDQSHPAGHDVTMTELERDYKLLAES